MKQLSSPRRMNSNPGLRCTLALLATAACAIAARGVERPEATPKIRRVALFKNGLGCFTAEAVLPKGAASIRLGAIPVPSQGTFWITCPERLKLRALYLTLEPDTRNRPALDLLELLRANPGREVTIHTTDEPPGVLRGVILAQPAEEASQPERPSPYRTGPRPLGWPHRRAPLRNAGPPKMVLIETKNGVAALAAGAIRRVEFAGKNVQTTLPRNQKRPVIRIELGKAANGESVALNFLARGIAWNPSYLFDITDPKTATLTAKAVVINEAADLNAVHLELISGFPNIRFGDVASPIAGTQTLAAFLNALTSDRPRRRNRGYLAQQAMVANAPLYMPPAANPTPGYSTARKGTSAEDLFFYPVDSFTLARGETACIPLFTARVPYTHIYTWKIPDMLDENERYHSSRNRDERLSSEVVWHCCRTTNTMKMPWTTAAAEFIRNGRIAGQDICYYTPPGAETTIRITRAMNIHAEQAERELERKRGAAHFYGSTYDLVKVKGELKLENRTARTVAMEITKELSGEVQETTPAAKDIPTAKGLKRVNTRHRLIWRLPLKPGENRTITYTYAVYIRL